MSNAQVAKYSNEFLAIGVGARQLGLAGSQTSTIGDVYSSYWNPAGLTRLGSDIELGGMHNEYYASMGKLDFLGIGVRASDSTMLSASMIRFGNDNIPNTLDLIDETGAIRYDRLKSFSAVDYAFLFSVARRSRIPNLRIGVSCKVIYRTVGSFGSAWGFGFDAGAQYEHNKWFWGLMLFDATSTFNAWWWNTAQLKTTFALTGNALPQNHVEITTPRSNIALARRFEFGANWSIIPSIEALLSFDGKRNTLISTSALSVDPHAGVELSFKQIAFLRMGVKNMQSLNDANNEQQLSVEPCFGAGLIIKQLSIDYALTNMGGGIGLYSNVFSVRYLINKKS